MPRLSAADTAAYLFETDAEDKPTKITFREPKPTNYRPAHPKAFDDDFDRSEIHIKPARLHTSKRPARRGEFGQAS